LRGKDQILKEIRERAEKKKRKNAETFKFKPENLVQMPCRVRPDQKRFLDFLRDNGFDKPVLIRKALDRELRRKDYRKYLEKFKKEDEV
jgi:hypothetical protein